MTPPPVDETSLLSFTTLLWGVRNFAIARLQKDNGWGLPARVVHSLVADDPFSLTACPGLAHGWRHSRAHFPGFECEGTKVWRGVRVCFTSVRNYRIPSIEAVGYPASAGRPRRMQGAWLAVSNWRLFLYLHPGVCRGEFSQAFICQQDNRD